MDAVKFIEERNRMCGTMSEVWGVDAAQIVKNTEEWSVAHPRKTRQSVFLEQYPNAKVVGDTDIPCVYSCEIDHSMEGVKYCNSLSCPDCRREYWLQEVE